MIATDRSPKVALTFCFIAWFALDTSEFSATLFTEKKNVDIRGFYDENDSFIFRTFHLSKAQKKGPWFVFEIEIIFIKPWGKNLASIVFFRQLKKLKIYFFSQRGEGGNCGGRLVFKFCVLILRR